MLTTEEYIGKRVRVTIDRPIGSRHPKHGFEYPVNYGYLPDTTSGDGEELDAYVLGVGKPLLEFEGICVAVVRRLTENDDKLVVVSEGTNFSDAEVEEAVHFQEKWYPHRLIRLSKKNTSEDLNVQ